MNDNHLIFEAKGSFKKIVYNILPASIILITTVSSIFHHFYTALPTGYSLETLVLFDLFIIVLILPLIYHCFKKLGKFFGFLFFCTSFLFMVVFENLWILMGRFHILGEAYTFNIGFLWFFDVPVNVGLGWFLFNYMGYYLLKRVFPDITRGQLCILNGLLALSFDLWIDPLVVNSHLATGSAPFWNWTPSLDPRLFTVPIYNYIGWFLGISIFTFIYDSTWGLDSCFWNDPNKRITQYFQKIIVGWIILDLGGRLIPIALNLIIPSMNLFPMEFTPEPLLWFNPILLCIPFSILGMIVIYYLKQSRQKVSLKQDFSLMTSLWGYILLNLSMATNLQIAFSGIFLVWIVIIPFNFIAIILVQFIRKAR